MEQGSVRGNNWIFHSKSLTLESGSFGNLAPELPSCRAVHYRQCIVALLHGYSMETRLSLDIIKTTIFLGIQNLS
jgi:hypothetical protein